MELKAKEPKELMDLHAQAKKNKDPQGYLRLPHGTNEPNSGTMQRHDFLLNYHPDIQWASYGQPQKIKTKADKDKYYIETTKMIIAELRKMPAFLAAVKRGGSGRRSATDKRATHYKKLRKDQLVQTALDVVDGHLPTKTEKN